MKQLRVFLISVAVALSASASAQVEMGVFNHLGISAGVGTTGLTLDAAMPVTKYLGVRGGVDLFPSYTYKTDLDLNIPGQANQAYSTLFPGQTLPSKAEVEAEPKLSGGHVLLDVHPMGTGFRITAGLYFGSEEVINVTNTDQTRAMFQNIYNFNHSLATQGLPSDYKIGVNLGDYFLEPDAQGNVKANVRVKKVRPYVGLGFGRPVPKKRLAFNFDIGVQIWGKPEVWLNDEKKLEKDDFDGDGSDLVDVISKISVYPTLTFRLAGRIF